MVSGRIFFRILLSGAAIVTPSEKVDIVENIEKNNAKGKKTPGKILQECPMCKESIYLDVDHEKFSVSHKCSGCKESWNFYYDDEQIYRFTPTFIVSTVDKLAAIGYQRKFRNLFGGKLFRCPKGHGLVPSGDICNASANGPGNDGEIFHKSVPIIIQNKGAKIPSIAFSLADSAVARSISPLLSFSTSLPTI